MVYGTVAAAAFVVYIIGPYRRHLGSGWFTWKWRSRGRAGKQAEFHRREMFFLPHDLGCGVGGHRPCFSPLSSVSPSIPSC